MKLELTKTQIDKLMPGRARYEVWDTRLKGFGVRVGASGEKVFVLKYRHAGERKLFKIGRYDDAMTAKKAREEAEKLVGDVRRGKDPMGDLQDQRRVVEAARTAPTVEEVARDWIERVAKKKNRTWKEAERVVNRHIVPTLGRKLIATVRRSDINDLLDSIEETAPVMAERVLMQLRTVFNWYALRDETFVSPIVRGMGRISWSKLARDRVLTDDELRIMWQVLDKTARPFRQIVRFLLLSAQRRDEVAEARRREFEGDVWTIPPERYKTDRVSVVALSVAAMDQLAELDPADDAPRPKPTDYVFTTTKGNAPFSGFSKAKARLDMAMEIAIREEMTNEQSLATAEPALNPWRLHDLRRTAKTLMARVGIRPDISERVLGHVIGGVEGTYDRHDYIEEKRDALEALAREVARIVEGRPANVIPLRPRAANHAKIQAHQ